MQYYCTLSIHHSSLNLTEFITRLSILAASLKIARLKSRDLFPLEHLIFFVFPTQFNHLIYQGFSTSLCLTPLLGEFAANLDVPGTETKFRDCPCVLYKQATGRFPSEQYSISTSCYSIIENPFLFF